MPSVPADSILTLWPGVKPELAVLSIDINLEPDTFNVSKLGVEITTPGTCCLKEDNGPREKVGAARISTIKGKYVTALVPVDTVP